MIQKLVLIAGIYLFSALAYASDLRVAIDDDTGRAYLVRVEYADEPSENPAVIDSIRDEAETVSGRVIVVLDDVIFGRPRVGDTRLDRDSREMIRLGKTTVRTYVDPLQSVHYKIQFVPE